MWTYRVAYAVREPAPVRVGYADRAKMAALSDAFALYPPQDWFAPPTDMEPGQRPILTDDGRFLAIVAPFDQCILDGREGSCWTAPPSPTQYAAAHQGVTRLEDGSEIDTANIGGGVNHAPPTASMRQAVDHYANTASQLLRVRYSDVPGVGIVAAGAAWPGISDFDVAKIRASPLSGDWRFRPELNAYDMSGAQFVSNPGFPRMPKVLSRSTFQPLSLAASLSDPHPAIIGSWVCNDQGECHMAPEPSLTLTLSASEAARLHELLTVPAQTAAAPCACSAGHTAAPGVAVAPGPEAAPVTRDEFDTLMARLDALEQAVVADGLADVDGMVAALPELVATG